MDKKLILDTDSKILRYKNILAIPSIHSRVYFSLAVRDAFENSSLILLLFSILLILLIL